jgi:hypothetical protein
MQLQKFTMAKKKRGRPPGRTQDRQLLMRVSAEFLENLDDWCAKQPDKPTRADAIRRFVERGIKTGRR